ncbi:MAG: UDP-N-acetylmuramate dehydrogenase [Bacteroidota bacterium]
MSTLQSHISLGPYNTFGIDVSTHYWIQINSFKEAEEFIIDNINNPLPTFILGGGSNILFTQDFKGVMIYNQVKGKEVLKETADEVWLKVGAGENWHELVMYCLEKDWGGIENLSLIPGSVGAAPIQNIGAYGVEIKEVFDHLVAIDLQTGHTRTFRKAECRFGYRDSIFKRQAKGRYMITHVVFRLSRHTHTLHTNYGAITQYLEEKGLKPSIHTISEAVISIRQSKLPDPKVIGNAGSFFKNPVISADAFARIQGQYPQAPHYPQNDGNIKVPAGWLIQTCGWKGHDRGNHGVHDRQALVLVNRGGASGQSIYDLSEEILQDVHQTFGIALTREVNIM